MDAEQLKRLERMRDESKCACSECKASREAIGAALALVERLRELERHLHDVDGLSVHGRPTDEAARRLEREA